MFLRKLVLKILLVVAFSFLASCEVTKALWEDEYEETVEQFLVSADGRYVVFLCDKYHYVFADPSGVIKELINLDRERLVLIAPEFTKLEVDGKNNIYGHIGIKTFDLDLTPQQRMFLFSLGFKQEKKESELVLKLRLEGKRYRGVEDVNSYYLALQDKYIIKIRHRPTPIREFENLTLTPLAIIADTVLLSKEIVMAPFRE